MLIVLFIAAIVSGGLAIWLIWAQGIVVALLSGAVVASVTVALLGFVLTARRVRNAPSESDAARGIFGVLGPRQRR
jgi:hypothetical protein